MKIQIGKTIFLNTLDTMKRILDLIAFKTDENSKEYKYYKKEIMDNTYKNLKKLFKILEDEEILIKCPKRCSLRKGYSKCLCGGSGYINFVDKKTV